MTYDGAFTVVVGKLELRFHQQTKQHPADTQLEQCFMIIIIQSLLLQIKD